ncbi:MAG: hypothetical protein QHC90_25195 [Shinella sp.]|nr:hypothetical protein [Shinella sp.]
MNEDKSMGISRAKTLEWNLNTIIQLVTLVGVCVGGVVIWVDKSRDIEDLQAWRAGHETYHKDRLAEVKANESGVNQRLSGIEADVRKVTNMSEQLAYRVTVAEQSTTTTASAIKELQATLSQQSGDLKVVREILQRIEAAQRTGRP